MGRAPPRSIEELREERPGPLPAMLDRFQSAQVAVLGDRTGETKAARPAPELLIALPGFVVHERQPPEQDTKLLDEVSVVPEAQRTAVRDQMKALDADKYQITVTSSDSSTPLYVGLDRSGQYMLTAKPLHLDAEQVQKALPHLNALNRDGYNVQMTPKDSEKDYVVVDSMTPGRLKELKEAGFKPAVVQQVGESITVVMKVDKLAGDADKAMASLSEELRGDQLPRSPAEQVQYEIQRSDLKDAGGDVRLMESGGAVDSKSVARLQELGARGVHLKSDGPAPAVVEAYNEVRNALEGGDEHAKDAAAARHLISRGVNGAEIAKVVAQESAVPDVVGAPKEAYAKVLVDKASDYEKANMPVPEILLAYRRSERTLPDSVGSGEREVDVAVGQHLRTLGANTDQIIQAKHYGSPGEDAPEGLESPASIAPAKRDSIESYFGTGAPTPERPEGYQPPSLNIEVQSKAVSEHTMDDR